MMELIQAKQDLRISRLQDETALVENIAYCVKVSGLNNTMPIEDKYLLIQKTKQFYGYLHPNELKLAFDFALQGLTQCDTRHFQNFSIAYFTQIVNAYLEYRNKEVARVATKTSDNQLVIKTDIEKMQIQKEYDIEVVMPIFEKYKMYGVVQIDLTLPKMVYQSLIEHHKILSFTSEQKQEIYKLCSDKYQEEKERVKQSKVKSMADYKKRKAFLAQIDKPEGEKTEVLDIIYKHCVGLAFDVMIEKSISLC